MTTEAVNGALIDSWALSLHDKRPRTVALYLEEVRRFAVWLAVHDRPEDTPGDLAAVGKRDVEAWIADQRAAGRAGNTIRNRWICLRSFYGWAAEEGEVEVSPVARIVVPKPELAPVPTVGADDLAALLRACEGTDFADRRDLALIRMLAATGLRVSELCGLELEDVDLRARTAYVRGKAGKDRIVRFDAKTAAALDRYRRVRARHLYASSPRLFLGYRGPLTRSGVPVILDRRAAQAGVSHVHAHVFRHTWADRWLSSGGQEGDLQRLGGWTNATVMRRYGSHRASERAMAAYDNVNPMGRL